MAIARREVTARLRDADDGTARLQFFAREAVIHETFDVECRRVGVQGIVEPLLTTQALGAGWDMASLSMRSGHSHTMADAALVCFSDDECRRCCYR